MSETQPRLTFDFRGEDPRDDGPAPRLVFANPVRVIVARETNEVLPALKAVAESTRAGLWAAGYVGYEAAPAFDPALRVHGDPAPTPLLWFGLFESPTDVGGASVLEATDVGTTAWQSDVGPDEFAAKVDEIQQAIARGETYQVNYTRRTTLHSPMDGRKLYERMCGAAGAGYFARLEIGDFEVVSASPELFFRTDGQSIVTRPMKGTAARGRWTEEDQAQADALRGSAKERAENVMIVDLLRNDLGRIALPGSVRVDSLFSVERYPTVLQLTSTISAQLRPDIGLPDIFKALFPCGSVTGAPKISTMAHITALETGPRGLYCGAIGYVRPGGDAIFSIAIRTALLKDGEITYSVGGGITSDSRAAAEWAETEAKRAVLLRAIGPPEQPFDLLETLWLSNGDYYLRQRHLARLAESAAYFGRPCDLARIDAALEEAALSCPVGAYRVRLVVAADGTPRVKTALLAANPCKFLTVALAREPVDGRDPFLCHKTTRRVVYETRRADAPWADDVLLFNRQGEITEFTIGNVLVVLPTGETVTPPRDCGLLAGTKRAEMLSLGVVSERRVTVEEIRDPAVRLYFVNSVRGSLPARLILDQNH
jgi:para-aminobenzoate synthetase/4-amino-4-deoxychorismate lyase